MNDQQLHRVFDQIKPSPHREQAILERLLAEERRKPSMTTKKLPRLAVAATAAAILLTTGVAAVVTGLDRRILTYFGGTPETEPLLSTAAVAVDREIHDQGSTLHLRQVIADRYSAVILMDFTAPEGTVLDGDYYTLDQSVSATAPDGTEISAYGAGWTLLEDDDPADNRVTLLFTLHSVDGSFNFLGAKLSLAFDGLYDDNLSTTCLAPGQWDCKLTLPAADPGRQVTLDAPLQIGDSQVTLANVYLSPVSLTWELAEGEDDLRSASALLHDSEDWQQELSLTTAGGDILPAGACNFLHSRYKTDLLAQDRGLYSFRLDSILDPAEVTSITLFGQTFDLPA